MIGLGAGNQGAGCSGLQQCSMTHTPPLGAVLYLQARRDVAPKERIQGLSSSMW